MTLKLAATFAFATPGCSTPVGEEAVAPASADALSMPLDQAAPPPVSAMLAVSAAVAGAPITLIGLGFPSGAQVTFIASTNTTAPGACPPPIAPSCLAVPAPFITLGTRTVDAEGRVSLTAQVPDPAPPRIEFQAYGAQRGVYYLSNGVVSRIFTSGGDYDGDGVTNLDEMNDGTDLSLADTDGDLLDDGAERAAGTDPRTPDSDGDGLSDGVEDADLDGSVDPGETNPTDFDSDDDNVGDGDELLAGTEPLAYDTDGDGLGDDELAVYGTDPLDDDTDGGRVRDGEEVSRGTDPLDPADDPSHTCGNRLLERGEDCDDGNTVDGDSCPSNCVYPVEVEPNDEPGLATGPLLPPSWIYSALDPVGDEDWLQITIPAWADLLVDVYIPWGYTNNRPEVTLYQADGTTYVPLGVDFHVDGYPFNPLYAPGASHLAPGTYLLRTVESGWGVPDPAGILTSIGFAALCGDGTVSGAEECDGGATCDIECQRVPVCNDGYIDAPETCDDRNTTPGDGCSNCLIEGAIQEIEPNDSMANADAAALAGLVIDGPVVIAAPLYPATDRDYFRVDVVTPQVVTFELFDSVTTNDVLSPSFTTRMYLYNAAGVEQVWDGSVETAGIRGASALSWPFETPGSYYLQVEESFRDAVIPAYRLQVQYPPAAGGEVEPNNLQAQATALAGSNGWIAGSHRFPDQDWYSLVVGAGMSVRLETIEGNSTERCDFFIHTHLELFDAAGNQLASDYQNGRGNCSIIDGTGTNPAILGAHNLPAGTYFVRVSGNNPFDYKLIWTVRSP